MIKKKFDCFNVYQEVDNNVFIHIEIKDEEAFYENLFEYFFSEDKLLRYCENNKHHYVFIPENILSGQNICAKCGEKYIQ